MLVSREYKSVGQVFGAVYLVVQFSVNFYSYNLTLHL